MVDEDMHDLGSTFVFLQFLLSFCYKIVRVEFLHHVGAEKIDGTQVTVVGPVCGLGCYIEILSKIT